MGTACAQVNGAASDQEPEFQILRAIPVAEPFVAQEDLVGPPTRAEVAEFVSKNATRVEQLEWAVKHGVITKRQALKISSGWFPVQIIKDDEEGVLPFKKARLDVFMAGTRLHGIDKEFAVLTLDHHVRAIGLVSSGKSSTPTPARQWEIYGVDKNRKSLSHGQSPMPYAIMLSDFGSKFYSETALHGTYGYGYGGFGSNRSHGCVRLCTEYSSKGFESDAKALWPSGGFHRVLWNLLNPQNYQHADHLDDVVFGSWYFESDAARDFVRELRYKTTVRTHSAKSLSKADGWKAHFENLYPRELILAAITQKNGGRGYKQFSADSETRIEVQKLKDLYELEKPFYKIPKYLDHGATTSEDHYHHRHLRWLE